MDLGAVIAVREGSTRVRNKNKKPFAGSSLLEIKIEQLKKVSEIKDIIVSTDSEAMIAIALEHGVKAIKRPFEYCDEKSKTFNEVVEFIANNQVQNEYLIWTPCVCPLIDDHIITTGIEFYKKRLIEFGENTSIASAVSIKEYLFDEEGPANFSVENHVPSQKLPDWHYVVNGFFISKTENMAKWKFVYGPNVDLFEVDKRNAIDIDDETDFMIAEMLYKMVRENE